MMRVTAGGTVIFDGNDFRQVAGKMPKNPACYRGDDQGRGDCAEKENLQDSAARLILAIAQGAPPPTSFLISLKSRALPLFRRRPHRFASKICLGDSAHVRLEDQVGLLQLGKEIRFLRSSTSTTITGPSQVPLHP